MLIRDSPAILVVEHQIMCNMPLKEVPLGLMAAFYVFNMEYPKGIQKTLMALEIIVLDIVPAKVHPKVASFLTQQFFFLHKIFVVIFVTSKIQNEFKMYNISFLSLICVVISSQI